MILLDDTGIYIGCNLSEGLQMNRTWETTKFINMMR